MGHFPTTQSLYHNCVSSMYPGADTNRAKKTCLQQIQEINEIFEINEIKRENQKSKVNDDTEIVPPGDGPISFLLF